jgi:acyl-[acyl-carrier-protein]-phospholipid O-acyltransferase/long-chain-fatty-acid--[acyl-carrier-protein] ligase
MGLPNLWIPKVVKQVAEIPILATGKLDLRACQRLASQASPTETPVSP